MNSLWGPIPHWREIYFRQWDSPLLGCSFSFSSCCNKIQLLASSVARLPSKHSSLRSAGRAGSAVALVDISLMSDKEVTQNRKQQLFNVIVSLIIKEAPSVWLGLAGLFTVILTSSFLPPAHGGESLLCSLVPSFFLTQEWKIAYRSDIRKWWVGKVPGARYIPRENEARFWCQPTIDSHTHPQKDLTEPIWPSLLSRSLLMK